jgi:hypothetical protein
MSLYERLVEAAKKCQPAPDDLGISSVVLDTALILKLLCDEVEKLQQPPPTFVKECGTVLSALSCVECEGVFFSQEKSDMFCSICSEKYHKCGCRKNEGCLCYTR